MSETIFISAYLLIGLIIASFVMILSGYKDHTSRVGDDEPLEFLAILTLWPLIIILLGFATAITGLKFLGKSLRRR